jgi:HAD superfamily hydrolase (TIGR01509 family)
MSLTSNYFTNPVLAALLNNADVVISDFNGLMVDDEPMHLAASNFAIAELDKTGAPIVMTDAQWGEICVGHHPVNWLPIILGRPLEEGELDAFQKIKAEKYFELVGEKARNKDPDFVRPGVLELIKYIYTKTNKSLALATTASPNVVEKVLGKEGLNILHLFAFTLCADQVTKPKPDPEIYLKIKEHFGQTLHYLVFEDSKQGKDAAKGAGMDCIAVPNRYTRT